MAAVEVHGLTKVFGARNKQVRALDGLDLDVPAGTVLGLLGPNGAGKTTTVRVLTTLLPPDAGEARVLGHDVTAEPAVVRRLIGLSGQYSAVDENLTGRENLWMFGRLYGLDSRSAAARADELLLPVRDRRVPRPAPAAVVVALHRVDPGGLRTAGGAQVPTFRRRLTRGRTTRERRPAPGRRSRCA